MKKILVLEDEANIRSFVVINLTRAGYEAIEAGTGQEALDRLAENLDAYRAALRSGDVERLREKLIWSASRKHRLDLGQRPADPYYV